MGAGAEHAALRERFEATALPFMAVVHNVALRLARRPEDAADLVQETLLRAFRGFDGFAPGTNCRAWLLTILYSVFNSRYRKAQREPRGVSVEELEERYHVWLRAGEESDPSAGQGFGRGWAEKDVETALAGLPESFRAAVLMVDVGELSYEEAAAALDCPVGTLRSRLFRARRLLFIALRDYARQAGYDTEKATRT